MKKRIALLSQPLFGLFLVMLLMMGGIPNARADEIMKCLPGSVSMAFGDQSPAEAWGYLPCDGRELNRAEYPELFNTIGYRYGGSGDKFALPDMQSRMPLGVGAGEGLTARTLGETGGHEKATKTDHGGALAILNKSDSGMELDNMPPYFTTHYMMCVTSRSFSR